MDGIFYVKKCGSVETVKSSKGESMSKRTVVLATKECRSGENGTYAVNQELVVDLLGERAENFNVPEGSLIAANYNVLVREHDGQFYQDARLSRYCRLN